MGKTRLSSRSWSCATCRSQNTKVHFDILACFPSKNPFFPFLSVEGNENTGSAYATEEHSCMPAVITHPRVQIVSPDLPITAGFSKPFSTFMATLKKNFDPQLLRQEREEQVSPVQQLQRIPSFQLHETNGSLTSVYVKSGRCKLLLLSGKRHPIMSRRSSVQC